MKSGVAVQAWLGLILAALGTFPAFSSSDTWVRTGQLGAGIGYGITFFIGIFGFALAIICGFIAKPKFLWLGAIILGILYIASFYGYIIPSPESVPTPNGHHLDFVTFLFLSSPGILAIIAGIFMFIFHAPASANEGAG
jgi:hypothetical protein